MVRGAAADRRPGANRPGCLFARRGPQARIIAITSCGIAEKDDLESRCVISRHLAERRDADEQRDRLMANIRQ